MLAMRPLTAKTTASALDVRPRRMTLNVLAYILLLGSPIGYWVEPVFAANDNARDSDAVRIVATDRNELRYEARDVSRQELLNKLAASAKIQLVGGELIDDADRHSGSDSGPAHEVLGRLLEQYNHVFVYAPSSAPHPLRVETLFILGLKRLDQSANLGVNSPPLASQPGSADIQSHPRASEAGTPSHAPPPFSSNETSSTPSEIDKPTPLTQTGSRLADMMAAQIAPLLSSGQSPAPTSEQQDRERAANEGAALPPPSTATSPPVAPDLREATRRATEQLKGMLRALNTTRPK